MTLVPASNHNGIALLCVVSIFGTLAVIAVGLRLWARQLKKMPLAMNDYFCVVALFFLLALIASSVCTVIWGIGLDESVLFSEDPQQLVRLAQNEFAGQLLWAITNTCIRTSTVLLYTTIFHLKTFRLLANILLGLNAAFGLAIILQTFLICMPVAYNWDKTIPGGSCGNQMAANMGIGIVNICLDVMVVCIPMPVVWSLKMARGKKIALSLIFSMGILICILTIVRVQQLSTFNQSNISQAYAIEGILADMEPLLGIINACLPVLRPVVVYLFPSKMSATTQKYASYALQDQSKGYHSNGGRKFGTTNASITGGAGNNSTVSWTASKLNQESQSSKDDLVKSAAGIYVQTEWEVAN